MGITKARLQELREVDLQTEILIPLFKAMGFRDVRHYHGGAGEQGKDIVMWWPTALGDREYHAVVVKAAPISGQAKGTGSAGEVFMQVSQALGSKFVDSDLTERAATKCFVVTSYPIRKEAADSLRSAVCGNAAGGSVRLIDGDELWELLMKHTPEQTVVEHLQFASAALENASPHYRVTAQLVSGCVQLGVQAKHPLADQMEPLEFTAEFEFPADETGAAAIAALESHVRRGTPVTIPAEFIKRFEPPPLLKPFLSEPVNHLALGPVEAQKTFDASITIMNPDAQEACISGIQFRFIQVGTEELTLSNEGQDVPWAFSLTLNRVSKRGNLQSTLHAGRHNVKREAEAARFQRSFARGGVVTLASDETGLPFLSMNAPPGLVSEPPAAWLRFVESLLFLQHKCGVVVSIPDDVSRADAEEVIELADQIRAGIWEGHVKSTVLHVKAGGLPGLLKQIDPIRPNRIVMVREEWLVVFGVKFPLGTVVRATTHMTATEECRARLIDHNPAQDFDLTLEPADMNSVAVVAFPRWLDETQMSALRGLFPGVSFELSTSGGDVAPESPEEQRLATLPSHSDGI